MKKEEPFGCDPNWHSEYTESIEGILGSCRNALAGRQLATGNTLQKQSTGMRGKKPKKRMLCVVAIQNRKRKSANAFREPAKTFQPMVGIHCVWIKNRQEMIQMRLGSLENKYWVLLLVRTRQKCPECVFRSPTHA